MELFWLILTTLCIKNVYNFQLDDADLIKPNVLAVNYPDADFYKGMFQQNLDHFHPSDTRTWLQRYTVYDKYSLGPKNVAFLFIGGENDYNIRPMKTLVWLDYAKTFYAICFHVEHRYYGKSHPTEDLSVENLRYLTSRQALADLANFMNAMNKKYHLTSDVKWIVFGDGYAGALATWLRKLYPNLVHGAVSSSGILQAKLNYGEYHKALYDILRSHSDACLVAVKNAFNLITFLLKTDSGRAILDDLLHPDIPFESIVRETYNIDYFYYVLSSLFHENILNRYWKTNLNIWCTILTNETIGIELLRLAEINDLMLENRESTTLSINYTQWMDWNKITRWNTTQARAWSYQQCTEFGLFSTSDYKPQIFGNKYPLDFFITKCQRMFDPRFDKFFISSRVDKTNFIDGRWNIRVSNVVFVYGSMDIWRPLGIKNTVKDSSIIVINGAINSEVSDKLAQNDSPEMEFAREKIHGLIGQWLIS